MTEGDGPTVNVHFRPVPFEHLLVGQDLNSEGLIDGLEGRKSLEIIHAIYESAETGQAVSIGFSPSKSKLGRR